LARVNSPTISVHERFPLERWESLRGFFEENYWPDVAIASREYFAWQLKADAVAADVITAWDGDRIVATLGFAAHPVFWGATAEPVDGAWLVAWIVKPEYRHGIGLALLRALQQRCPVVLGIGARPESERIFTRLGWGVFPSVSRYLAVFDAERAQAFCLPGVTREDIRPPLHPSATYSRDHAKQWAAEDYAPAWSRYDALRFGSVRSNEFLRWRYAEHPVYRFTVLTCGDRQRPAVCVYRIEQPSDVDWKVGRVLEFFHPSDALGRRDGLSLLRSVEQRLAAQGCAFADHVNSSAEYGDTLSEAGWLPEPAGQQLLAVRLQPVERVPYLRFNVEYGIRPGLARPSVGAMYVTRGDGDADRPTVIPRAHA